MIKPLRCGYDILSGLKGFLFFNARVSKLLYFFVVLRQMSLLPPFYYCGSNFFFVLLGVSVLPT